MRPPQHIRKTYLRSQGDASLEFRTRKKRFYKCIKCSLQRTWAKSPRVFFGNEPERIGDTSFQEDMWTWRPTDRFLGFWA